MEEISAMRNEFQSGNKSMESPLSFHLSSIFSDVISIAYTPIFFKDFN